MGHGEEPILVVVVAFNRDSIVPWPAPIMNISCRKRIPYPFKRVVAQYFDLEHIETVHPKTLGEYRLLEVSGDRIVFEQRWPPWLGVRARTIIEQVWVPPDRIHFRFLKGFLRGVEISSWLHDGTEDTLIEERYHLPLVPEWSWLRVLVRPFVVRGIDYVWNEDLAVELCHGGWPGVPGQESQEDSDVDLQQPALVVKQERWVRVAEQEEVLEERPHVFQIDEREIVLWKYNEYLHAFDHRCPHTGGPLSLGRFTGDRVACPWHGSRFGLDDGVPCNGPAEAGVNIYRVRVSGGGILIQVPGGK